MAGQAADITAVGVRYTSRKMSTSNGDYRLKGTIGELTAELKKAN
jgi:hypothetical protein